MEQKRKTSEYVAEMINKSLTDKDEILKLLKSRLKKEDYHLVEQSMQAIMQNMLGLAATITDKSEALKLAATEVEILKYDRNTYKEIALEHLYLNQIHKGNLHIFAEA
ncbi:hypothetical protein [Algivirga pacifica]|uniref:Uncharacterized protein n=1 Tax=Algivirga pacifica TaxID=1162670 RepID=A0ABP9DHM8_9BACT